ncbi:hypothetical protein S40293_09823 [Stachybotrys chartarum IBT 40293]|nr:hypothetical protein S40293_09823 [Stachybotrys chartarum IBT 40293]
MVYRGPSKACQTCRRRRVKVHPSLPPYPDSGLIAEQCDEKAPCCGGCTRLGLVCAGYSDVFERRHRSETRKVFERNNGHLLPRRRSRGKELAEYPSAIELPTALMVSVETPTNNTTSYMRQSLVLSSPPLDSKSAALGFFFLAYGPGREHDATCSSFELLPALYAKCRADSPLAFATAALALSIHGLWHRLNGNAVLASYNYFEAVSRTKEAIGDPIQSKSNDLLMTTLILEAYESVTIHYKSSSKGCEHLLGSIALIKHRGQMNYRDNISRRVFLAARSKIAYDALVNSRRIMNSSASFLCGRDVGSMPETPAVEVDKLAIRASELSYSVARERLGGVTRHSFLPQTIALAADCIGWIQSLPEDLKSVRIDGDAVAETIKRAGMFGAACDAYASLSIAALRNRHRLIELHAHQLVYQCQSDSDSYLARIIKSRVQCVVDEICASVPYHVGDMTEPINPIHGTYIDLSHIEMPPQTILTARQSAGSMSQHQRQIVSSDQG